ncbi:TonB-dependent siderophore receptor [Celerinatantimonas sp. MCCC 1A17872]|uniref:TonB-dependent siderophore receptor n=1 Tax=Celerinatantimonas sp. MCCC 1A17872 TaxID=3177514 RepID=UPI0038BE4343
MEIFSIRHLTLSVMIALSSLPAWAQDTVDQEESSSTDTITVVGNDTQSPDISGGTGMGLSAEQTPQSISVVDSYTMQDWGMDSLNDVLNNVIGISLKRDDDVRTEYQSRGFDINNIQIDGTPYAWGSLGNSSGQALADMSIYERVEVVRGATGLTTGVGDPSASINLVRKHADSKTLKGNVEATLGSWDQHTIMADVQNALNDDGSLRGRLVTKYTEKNSYVDLYSSKRKVLYGVVEKDINSNTSLRVGGNYQSDDIDGASWGGLPGAYSDGTATDLARSKTTATNWSYWNTKNEGAFIELQHTFANGWKWKTDYSYSRYEKQDKLLYLTSLDKTADSISAYPEKDHSNTEQNSLSTQLSGQYDLLGRAHDFTLGLTYSREKYRSYEIYADSYSDTIDNFSTWNNNYAEPSWSSSDNLVEELKTEQKGIFASTRLNVTDAFKFILGGRLAYWQREGQSYEADATYGDNGVFMPYAGALYDLNDQTRFYASYATIYEPQNAQTSTGKFLDPVKGDTYEIGMKNRYFKDRLRLNVALFRTEENNLAQNDPTGATIPNSEDPAQVAADGVTSKGFEVQVSGHPLEGLDMNLGYTQFQAKDKDGEEVNTDFARKQLKMMSSYQFVHLLPQLTMGVSLRWQGKTYSNDVSQPAYSLVDMMAKYQVNDNVVVNLTINNLFDKKYYDYLDSDNEVHYGAPLSGTLSVGYLF